MLAMVGELARAGIGILLCTHLLPDVQEVCERVVVIAAGRVVREGTVAELTQALGRTWKVGVVGDAPRLVEALGARGLEPHFDALSGDLRVTLPEGASPRLVLEAADASGVGLRQLEPGTRSLEEVFLESIGDAAHADS